MTPDGLFSVDVLLEAPGGRLVAVEADGPQHFTRTAPHQPLGQTILRQRLVQARVDGVVSIPFFEWDQVGGEPAAQEAYLKSKLAPWLQDGLGSQ